MERLLDEGGMASIYLARDLQTQAPVAIKCLYRIYLGSEIVRARFIDEGRIQMMLQHPNIVRVHQFVEQPTLAFVMEYVHGPTLEDLLADRGVMDMMEVLEVMVPVLSALGLAHSRHIVHRDLKPSNILLHDVGGEWHPKVMDFGVAKLKRTRQLTATGTTVGTLHYMSPEQIVGSKNIDGRADIYSLGITLYKLCTGDVPFNAATEFALMMAQVEAPPQPPSQLNPKISPEFEQVILKALAKKPEARYQNIKEFTSALLSLKDEHGKETIDTINIPVFLLEYAMMADQVAVDKTDEIMVRSRTLEEALQAEALHDAVETQEHVRITLPIPEDEEVNPEDASTIELDRLRIEHFHREDNNSTLDMSLDPTAKARISTSTLEQLVRESELRARAARGYDDPEGITQDSSVNEQETIPLGESLGHGEEDRTVPMRVKTSDLPPKRTTAPKPATQGYDPTHRHTPMFNESFIPLKKQAHKPNRSTARLPPHQAPPGKNPFDQGPRPSPLPAPVRRGGVVGPAGVDTRERTMPFTLPGGQEQTEPFELLDTADSGEHYAPTITADRMVVPDGVPGQMPMPGEVATTGQESWRLVIIAGVLFVSVVAMVLAVWAIF